MHPGQPGGGNGSRLSGGNGLGNLKTRMANVGGSCSCSAGTGGRGIRIVLEVPLGPGLAAIN
jgi:signal transduction histidine kinase